MILGSERRRSGSTPRRHRWIAFSIGARRGRGRWSRRSARITRGRWSLRRYAQRSTGVAFPRTRGDRRALHRASRPGAGEVNCRGRRQAMPRDDCAFLISGTHRSALFLILEKPGFRRGYHWGPGTLGSGRWESSRCWSRRSGARDDHYPRETRAAPKARSSPGEEVALRSSREARPRSGGSVLASGARELATPQV